MANSLKDDIRYQNHETRPDLAGEHLLGDTYQVIAFGIFIAAHIVDFWLIGTPQRFFHLVPLWVRLPLSAVLFSLGGWLSLFGIRIVFGEYCEDPIFRKEGMFSVVRHPIYLGAVLIYLAILWITLSILGGLVWVGIIGLYQWLAKYEEGLMISIFGDQYRVYQKEVPMWLPRPFKKRKK